MPTYDFVCPDGHSTEAVTTAQTEYIRCSAETQYRENGRLILDYCRKRARRQFPACAAIVVKGGTGAGKAAHTR